MSDEVAFFLVFLGLYLFDCVVWIAPHGLGIPWCRRRGAVAPPVLPENCLCNPHGAAYWDLPLRGGKALFLAYTWPVAVTPHGVLCALIENPGDGRRFRRNEWYLSHDEIDNVSISDRDLVVNGACRARTASAVEARTLADLIDAVRGAPECERAGIVDRAIAQRFDRVPIRARLDLLKPGTDWLQVFCAFQFAVMFVYYPLTGWLWDFKRCFLQVSIGSLVLALIIAFLYGRTHKSFHPRRRWARWKAMLLMLVAPPLSIRAGRQIALHLLADFHPVAVSAEAQSREGFALFAGMVGRDFAHPILTPFLHENEAALTALHWFRARLQEQIVPIVDENVSGSLATLGPPTRESVRSLAYCPRCLAQFKQPSGMCPDCRSVRLVAFAGRRAEGDCD